MMDVDVAVIGSGLSALKVLHLVKLYGKRALVVDVLGSDGGNLQLLDGGYEVAKLPIFMDLDDVFFLQKLGIDVACYEIEHKTLKSGNYVLKTLGFMDIDVQENWFVKWINSNRLCFDAKLFAKLKSSLGFPGYRSIHSLASIRKIDAEKKILVLSTGGIVRYSKIVYTWPLEILPQYLYPNTLKHHVLHTLGQLGLRYVSLYLYLAVARNTESVDNRITIYTHGTKASRMHTATVVYSQNMKVMYIATSHTNHHPLIPGVGEKIISELRKHRIASPTDILKKHDINVTYGLLNRINESTIKELEQLLENYNIILFGRVAQWREKTVRGILTDKTIEQKII